MQEHANATLTMLRFSIFMSTEISSINHEILYPESIHIIVQHIKISEFLNISNYF